MNQRSRDKAAIRSILNYMSEATYADIALRGGEGLYDPLIAMVQSGEVLTRFDISRHPAALERLYRLRPSVGCKDLFIEMIPSSGVYIVDEQKSRDQWS